MKRAWIRTTALALCLMLLAGALSACGGGTTAQTTAATTAAAKTSSTTAATTAAATAATTPAPQEPSLLSFLVPENDPASLPFPFADREKLSVWKEFERVAGENNLAFEFELIEGSQYAIVLQTRLAAGLNLPDIVNIGPLDTLTRMGYVKQGLFQSVTGIIDEHCKDETRAYIDAYYPQLLSAQAYPEDGETYWYSQVLTEMMDGKANKSYRGVLIRGDWLEDLGISMPATTQELYEACAAIQEQDANGSGTIGDERIIMAPDWLLRLFGGSYGLPAALTGVICDTGEVVSCWNQTGMQDFVAYCKLLYDEGILDISGGTNAREAAGNDTLLGTYGYPDYAAYDAISPDEDAVYLPTGLLRGRDDITPLAFIDAEQLVAPSISFAVMKNCEDPAAVGRLLDMLFTDWYNELTEYGIEGEGFEYTVPQSELQWFSQDQRRPLVADTVEAYRAAGFCNGSRLWAKGVFPWVFVLSYTTDYYNNIIAEYEAQGDTANAYRQRVKMESYGWSKTYSTYDAMFALPTQAQSERLDLLLTDLNTYHIELLTNLVTGTESLDDWDTFMSELKALGLDEVVSINQDRYNRRVGV